MIEKFERRSRSQLQKILSDLKENHRNIKEKFECFSYDMDENSFADLIDEHDDIIRRIEDVERELLYTDEDDI